MPCQGIWERGKVGKIIGKVIISRWPEKETQGTGQKGGEGRRELQESKGLGCRSRGYVLNKCGASFSLRDLKCHSSYC